MIRLTHSMTLILLAGLACVAACSDAARNDEGASSDRRTNGLTYEFTNGHWFNGESFESKTWYSVNGILSSRRPEAVDSVFDLGGGYVVPPFADAHTHLFDDPTVIDSVVEKLLQDGIIYAKEMNNSLSGRRAVDEYLPELSVDVAYANSGLTSTLGHPMWLYEAMALGFYTPDAQRQNAAAIQQSKLRANDAYFLVDSQEDLDAKWPRILEGEPDFIKIYLLHTSRFDENRTQPAYFGSIGLDPGLVPIIVMKAHESGLRVSAHVETAFDFRVAVEAGVDEMAHLPGYAAGEAAYAIRDEDAQLAAEREVVVTTTLSFAAISQGEDGPEAARVRAIQLENLRLLKKHGVRIAIGSDANTFSFKYGAGAVSEAMVLRERGVFSNAELLKMWVETTPQAIFPGRRIGRLQEGYEASFAVLVRNPLEEFDFVREVAMLWKQGVRLTGRE